MSESKFNIPAATYALPTAISLRDYFAAQALPWVTSKLYDTKEISVAKHCYALADALLAVSRGEGDINKYPVYTAPPQRKPLTDEEIFLILRNIDPETKRLSPSLKALVQEIEAAIRAGGSK